MASAPEPCPVSTTSNVTPQYDFKPFFSAPAVVQRAKQSNGFIQPLQIPETLIPSPLARDLSPEQLAGLKQFLVGLGPETSSRTGNGHEVWLSWKRAWDLWNNHYIHGRVNPVWIREQWERRENEKGDSDRMDTCSPDGSDMEMTDWDGSERTSRANAQGSSGGFRAIKDFAQFEEPPPFNEEKGDDGIVWDDLISNSVWRPRRVGEKTVKVDLDEDLEKFLESSPLERDRGVDCGRMPYPVLRPLIEYIKLGNAAIKKKKIWDGVTGTVFNMPTRPLQPSRHPEDERLDRVQQMFCNAYRDFKPPSANDGIFPLDIRRVTRVSPPPRNQIAPLVIENEGETLFYDRRARQDVHPFVDRNMTDEDPWWVTEEQRTLIDYPHRRFPLPEQKYKSEWIPTDDTIWRAELDRDQMYESRYFVTNLHGGTLLINGMEIRKGDVAGPLPKFAVVECPGGQIVFWFGVEGRKHGSGDEESHYEKWRALRRMQGWKFTGLAAGQVWNAKIKDRAERKKCGEDEPDDEQWDAWLSAEPSQQEQDPPTSVTYRLPVIGTHYGDPLPLPDNIAQPHVMFPSEWHEIAWLAAQSERQNEPRDLEDVAIIPDEEHWFPGSKLRLDYIKGKVLSQEEVDVLWRRKGNLIEDRQRVLLNNIRAEEKSKVRAEEERLKALGLFDLQQKKMAAVPTTAKARIHTQGARRKEQDLQRDIRGQPRQSREREERGVTANLALELPKRKTVQERDEAPKKRKVHFEGSREKENNQIDIPAQKTINENSIQKTKKPSALKQTKLPQALKTIQTKQSKFSQQPIPVQPSSHVTASLENDPQHQMVLANSFLSDNAQEALEILQAVTLSKKSYRENAEQAVLQRAAMSQKSVSEYLKGEGFANINHYLDTMLASAELLRVPPAPSNPARIPAPQGLLSYLEDLKKAHMAGSKARARLKNMSWEEYTTAETGLSPRAYMDSIIDEDDITVDDIPPSCITGGMTVVEEARARAKWDRLCGIIIDANDFEAQTQAASLPVETLRAVDGKSYTIL